MSGLETKELEELEQKNAPETVNTVTTSGTKRKRTRRPKLIWVMGEKMRADDPRRDAPFMDDEDITDDIQDWEPAKLEFHSIFASIYDVTHTFFGGAFGSALTSKILPYLVCDCRGRLAGKWRCTLLRSTKLKFSTACCLNAFAQFQVTLFFRNMSMTLLPTTTQTTILPTMVSSGTRMEITWTSTITRTIMRLRAMIALSLMMSID
jgi:hypothetical protein